MAGLLDFLQAASNSAASNVSAPVDGLAWLLKKAGIDVGEPVLGSAWLERQGLTRPVQQSGASVAGETAGLLAPMLAAVKAPQVAGGLLQGLANANAPRKLRPDQGAIVWHGSPHKFDRFDASKIGTGEGAQVYGHGLYFAESPHVAQRYAAMNTGPAGDSTAHELAKFGGNIDKYRKHLLNRYKDERASYYAMSAEERELANLVGADRRIDTIRALQDLRNMNLYKVDIPDSAISRMLDWDKPLSQQGMPRSLVNLIGSHPDNLRSMPADPTGHGFVQALQRYFKNATAGSEEMRKAGVPGIRYLDGNSRGADAGTSNFVVFPGEESLLTILERNGVPLR